MHVERPPLSKAAHEVRRQVDTARQLGAKGDIGTAGWNHNHFAIEAHVRLSHFQSADGLHLPACANTGLPDEVLENA